MLTKIKQQLINTFKLLSVIRTIVMVKRLTKILVLKEVRTVFQKMIESISFYPDEEARYTKDIKSTLNTYREVLINEFERYDRQKRGYVTFSELRRIFESLNVNIENELVEYIIYLLKTYEDQSTSIHDLRYENLLKILERKSQSKSSGNELELSQVILSKEEFNKRSERILKLLAEYIYHSELKLKDLFPNVVTIIEDSLQYKGFYLKQFVKTLASTVGITMDSTDTYCIFDRLKHPENVHNIEVIYLDRLIDEIANYNIIEDTKLIKQRSVQSLVSLTEEDPNTVKTNKENDLLEEEPESPIATEVIASISNYLKENSMTIDDLLEKVKSEITTINNVLNIQFSSFMKFLKIQQVIGSRNGNRVEFIPFMNGEALNLTEFRKIFKPVEKICETVIKAEEEEQANLIDILLSYLHTNNISFERFIFSIHTQMKIGANSDRLLELPLLIDFAFNKGVIKSKNIDMFAISDLLNDSGMLDIKLLKRKLEPFFFEDKINNHRKISKVIVDEIFSLQLKSKSKF